MDYSLLARFRKILVVRELPLELGSQWSTQVVAVTTIPSSFTVTGR